jgi:hypothetical protein
MLFPRLMLPFMVLFTGISPNISQPRLLAATSFIATCQHPHRAGQNIEEENVGDDHITP